ncbi:MAG: tRNA (guanine(46)-N(7))-methyltransferase TrmB [Candidatus Binatia bacterium]
MNFAIFKKGEYLQREFWLGPSSALSRVEIEIGSGNCVFIIEAARRNPDTLYAGFDIRRSVIAKATASAQALPPNLQLFNLDARWLVSELLAPNSIDALHVYFPDPWWKKRHHKRRLFNADFCRGVQRCLRPWGKLFLVTDVVSLGELIGESLLAAGLEARPWKRGPDHPPCSAYEKKYRAQGRAFLEIAFVKIP